MLVWAGFPQAARMREMAVTEIDLKIWRGTLVESGSILSFIVAPGFGLAAKVRGTGLPCMAGWKFVSRDSQSITLPKVSVTKVKLLLF